MIFVKILWFFENCENVFGDLEAAIIGMIFVDGALERTDSILSENRVFSIIRRF